MQTYKLTQIKENITRLEALRESLMASKISTLEELH